MSGHGIWGFAPVRWITYITAACLFASGPVLAAEFAGESTGITAETFGVIIGVLPAVPDRFTKGLEAGQEHTGTEMPDGRE